MALDRRIDEVCLTGAVARTLIFFHVIQDQFAPNARTPWRRESFDNFLRVWRLARTVAEGKRAELLRRLNDGDLRKLRSGNVESVESIAKRYRDAGLTPRPKNHKARTPRSLISKVGFLVNPQKLVPYDRFARVGLNKRRGRKREGGLGQLEIGYKTYIDCFNECFAALRPQIAGECRLPWACELARRLKILRKWRTSEALYRKILDEVLMTEAGRWDQSPKDDN